MFVVMLAFMDMADMHKDTFHNDEQITVFLFIRAMLFFFFCAPGWTDDEVEHET